LRVCPVGPLTDIWERSDNVLRCTLDHIIGSPLSDDQWSQATLPLSLGGLGICSAKKHDGSGTSIRPPHVAFQCGGSSWLT
jgi:hypothetical protein